MLTTIIITFEHEKRINDDRTFSVGFIIMDLLYKVFTKTLQLKTSERETMAPEPSALIGIVISFNKKSMPLTAY